MTVVGLERGLRRKPRESVHLRDREKHREGRDIQKASEKDQGEAGVGHMMEGKGSGVGAGLGQREFLCRVRTEKKDMLDCGTI